MRHFRTLLFHELRAALFSGNTWTVGGLFLTLMGGIYWYALLECSRSPQNWTPVEATFRLFWLPLLCILPLLTMRTFAEERRSGTLAALLTTPASTSAVVWAKFLAVWLVWVLFWIGFVVFPLIVDGQLGKSGDPRLHDASILWGGLCFIIVSGLLHTAIGILCSCLTRSATLAALLAFICLLALTAAGGALESLPIETWDGVSWLREPAAHLRTFAHLQDFAGGIFDSRPVVLYITGTLLCLGLSVLAVEGQE